MSFILKRESTAIELRNLKNGDCFVTESGDVMILVDTPKSINNKEVVIAANQRLALSLTTFRLFVLAETDPVELQVVNAIAKTYVQTA